MGAVSFAAPWLLLTLAGLPVLWWLLRVLPPAPRVLVFPAVRLLLGLPESAQTAARTPLWLLVLRTTAAALIIVGLAGPVLRAGTALPGSGPVLLVIDDGWASAPDWPSRLRSAENVLARAGAAGRQVALLATAPADDGSPPRPSVAMAAADLRPLLAILRAKPWPVARAAAAEAIRQWTAAQPGPPGSVAYVADGLTDGPGWEAFAAALHEAGRITWFTAPEAPHLLLLPPAPIPDGVTASILQAARPGTTELAVLAQAGDGRTLLRLPMTVPAGATRADTTLRLPAELRGELDRLVIDTPNGGAPGAGGVALLDAAARTRPVGLVAGDPAADTPLSGSLFYLRRALAPYGELRAGDIAALLSRPLAVLVLPDHPLSTGPEADQLARWVEGGGLLVRFAGPLMAQAAEAGAPDPLLPVPLLGAERELGGAMSWGEPAPLAAFPVASPFAGLAPSDDVRVTRQVLADPSGDRAQATWARLADGTPLVTQRGLGQGRIVLFHVTANADWSDLPLSGVFVAMLRRLVGLASGVAADQPGESAALLPPSATLDGNGTLGEPPPTASPVSAREIATATASPAHPPGFYGPETARHALNLGPGLPVPQIAPVVDGAQIESIGAIVPETLLGPWLIALALAILAADLVVSLRLRGLWRAAAAACALAMLATSPAQADEASPALATRLAYVVTGAADVDDTSEAGLLGLSAFVNGRTAAVLSEPVGVRPGQDDLSFYPLIYWPLSGDAPPPDPAAIIALNEYTAHGGVILIDTRDGGSGAGMNAGGREVLTRLGQGATTLAVPPLAPLTGQHVLARAFYLMSEFPGRYAGDTVWVGRDQDRTNDSVSPVIIGAHDWAAAWAVAADGRHPYATLPGGERQRLLAYRFGVNLIMYALTGNYKGDQVHVPALLERLGQ